jgi:3-hydroxyacyl-CoA dehydrogenase
MGTTQHARARQSVEKGKLTAEAAAAEGKAVEGRITYSLDLKDLKDVDLVIEVRTT